MLDRILDHLWKEGGALKGAPIAFALLLAAGLFGGYEFESMLTAERIATLETMVRERDGAIEGYQKTLSDRLDKVEKALSEQQISSLKSSLKDEHGSVDILDSNPTKPDPRADQLKSAFTESGWDVQTKSTQDAPADSLVLRAQDNNTASTLEKALKDAGVKYETLKPTDSVSDFILKGTK